MPRITPAAARRLRDELEQLTTTGREEVSQAMLDARQAGKMEENSDFWLANDERTRLESRIEQIQTILRESEVTDEAVDDISVVQEGCVVEVSLEGDDEVDTYYVGVKLGAPTGVDYVSPESPMGNALMGASVGEVVEFKVPGGARLQVAVTAVRAG